MAEQDNFIGQGAALNGQTSMRSYKEPEVNPFDAAIPGQSMEHGNILLNLLILKMQQIIFMEDYKEKKI
jgi:hypothetical protein